MAVRDRGGKDAGDWCLVDTTNLKVVSDHWPKDEHEFEAFGRLFWIGYCGPAAQYPVHSPTLENVPPSVLASALVQLKFTLDPSLLNPDGTIVNPRLSDFIGLQDCNFRYPEHAEPARCSEPEPAE